MEDRNYDLQKVNFHSLVLEGTSYEVGQQLGRMINKLPGGKEFATSSKIDLKKVGFTSFAKLWDYSEECCPGITQEIQGFADHFDITPDMVPFWNWTFNDSIGGGCSQLAVLPSITHDKQTFVGRSYEWNHKDEDLKLITTRVKGKAAHIGFSCLLHGRHDGMNEKGLVVSMTGGGIFGVPFKHRGPMFWLAIRTLLDTCASVDNALSCVENLPITGYFTLLFADKHSAAIVEVADGKMSTYQIDKEDTDQFIYSVNHFRLPDMIQFNTLNCGIISHSKIRQKLITEWYHSKSSNIRKEDILNLFASLHPEGLCNHFYNDGFGTLWSMIFDLKHTSVDVCFSAPTHNQYTTFDLKAAPGITEYPTIVPITKWY
ncbi:MAG: C45 family autoproteolytic acyltransferase/hydrolase [Promethearchaeota archaeon]